MELVRLVPFAVAFAVAFAGACTGAELRQVHANAPDSHKANLAYAGLAFAFAALGN